MKRKRALDRFTAIRLIAGIAALLTFCLVKFYIDGEFRTWMEVLERLTKGADIKNFKRINENFGHQAGDDVLRQVAGVLRDAAAGKGDVLRYSGDDFVTVFFKVTADTKPARIFGVSLAKCSILAAVVLAVFISWNRYTAAVTPTETTGASVGSAGLSYGAVLTGGIKQLLGIGREERFAQIMQSMGQAFLYRRVCLVGAPIMAVSCILLLFTAAFVAAPAGAARRRTVVGFVGGAFCFAALYLFHLILYFYNFSEAEGSALKDYERYIAPYLQGWMLYGFCVLGFAVGQGSGAAQRLGRAALGLAAAAVLGIFAWRGVPAAGFWTNADSLYTLRRDVKNRAEAMNTVLDWPDRVLVISQGDDATRWYYYKYELTAKVVNGYGGTWWGNDDYSSRWDSDFSSEPFLLYPLPSVLF